MNANKARLLSVVKQIKKRPVFASDMLTIVWILSRNSSHTCYAFMCIFCNFYSTVFSHFCLCCRIKFGLVDATFEMQALFSCMEIMN